MQYSPLYLSELVTNSPQEQYVDAEYAILYYRRISLWNRYCATKVDKVLYQIYQRQTDKLCVVNSRWGSLNMSKIHEFVVKKKLKNYHVRKKENRLNFFILIENRRFQIVKIYLNYYLNMVWNNYVHINRSERWTN